MEHINIGGNTRDNIYPLLQKYERQKGELIINIVMNGDNSPLIMAGNFTIGGWAVPKCNVLEVLEERPAKGDHQIKNPVFYSLRCEIIK